MPRAKRIKVRITKRGRERLKKLGEFLKTVPDERFDMGFWARIEGDDAQGEVGDTADCATAACALGWATVVFPRSLKLGWCHFARPSPYLNRMSAEVVRVGAGTKETCSGEDAAQDFFQMEEGLANYLFTPEADSMFRSGTIREHVIARLISVARHGSVPEVACTWSALGKFEKGVQRYAKK